MMAISITTLIIAIKKLCPRIKCYGFTCDYNNKSGMELQFINVRNRVVVINHLEYETGNELITMIPINNEVITTNGNTKIFVDFSIDNVVGKLFVVDIEGNKYKVEL